MKQLIIILMCLLMSQGAVGQNGDTLFDLDLRERAVLICKNFEGLHHNKGDYIGYGHKILPNESYWPNQELTPDHAELLLRLDLEKLHLMFINYGQDAWLLAALAYNVGPYALLGYGKNPKSKLLVALETGNRDIKQLYMEYCHAWGKPIRSIKLRRLVELELLYTP